VWSRTAAGRAKTPVGVPGENGYGAVLLVAVRQSKVYPAGRRGPWWGKIPEADGGGRAAGPGPWAARAVL
jgi:hypothetical protein